MTRGRLETVTLAVAPLTVAAGGRTEDGQDLAPVIDAIASAGSPAYTEKVLPEIHLNFQLNYKVSFWFIDYIRATNNNCLLT